MHSLSTAASKPVGATHAPTDTNCLSSMAMASFGAMWLLFIDFAVLSASVHHPLDAMTTLPEDQWYVAPSDWGFLHNWCVKWQGEREFSCVDVFSFSQRFASTFAAHGYPSVAFDVKGDPRDDITSKTGFLRLLGYGMSTLGHICKL